MHQLALAEKNHVNGSLKTGLFLKSEPDEDMDTDQILQILMVIQSEGARRDEKLTNIDKAVTSSADLQKSRIAVEDARYELMAEDIRQLKGRVKTIEDAGLAAWSVKKIIQWSALIAAVGTIVGSIAGVIIWVVKHLKV